MRRILALSVVLLVPASVHARPNGGFWQRARAVRQAAGTEALRAWVKVRHGLARPKIDRALKQLKALGTPQAPVLLTSGAERRLHGSLIREARMLRGARLGTLAHKRLQLVKRRLEALRVKRRYTRMPTWAAAQTDGEHVAVNVDKLSSPLTTLAHELRHVRDGKRRPWDGSETQRIGNERRAHRAEGLALGATGRPLRAHHYLSSKGTEQDKIYPPLLLGKATVHGYLIGIRRALGAKLRSASPAARARVEAYLKAYRREAISQSTWAAANKPPDLPTGALARAKQWLSWQRFRTTRAVKTPLRQWRQRHEPIASVEAARQAGRRDAQLDLSPLTRARVLLGGP